MSDDLKFKLHLPKLDADGSNWITYRDRMQWIVKMRGLGDHLMHATISPDYTKAGDVGGLKPAQRWTAGEIAVSQLFGMTIPDSVFHQIKSADNVRDIWDKLKALFEGKSRVWMIDVGRKFQNTRCGEDDDVHVHFEKLADLKERLAALGRTVSDDEYVSVLIGSLPPSYDPTINALTTSCDVNNKDITPAIVIRIATNEHEKRKTRKDNNKVDEALTAETEAEKRRNKHRNIECHNCQKKGHYMSECWAKGGGNEGGGPWKPRKNDMGTTDGATAAATESPQDESWAAIMDAESEGEPYDSTSVLTDGAALTNDKPEVELYDSGASQHMSPLRHRFTNFHPIPPRPITAADSQVFYAIGAGDLKIDVPNGSSFTSITLRDTLYAPDMGQTIVSISRITAAGHSVTFEGMSCKIANKAGKVVGDIPLSPNGLYKVEHSLAAAAASEPANILTVHRKPDTSVDTTHSLVRTNVVTGPHVIDSVPSSPLAYDPCDYAQAICKAICKESTTPLAAPFDDEVYSDVWGTSPIPSLDGRKYDTTITNAPIPPSLIPSTPLTTTTPQLLTLTPQQAAATLPTPPISTVSTAPALSTPTSTTSSTDASLLTAALQTPPLATDSSEEEPPKSAPKEAPAPSPLSQTTCKTARLAKPLQQATSPQEAGNMRASGGAGNELWKGLKASHLTGDEDFIFLSKFDPLIIIPTGQDTSDDPKSLNEARLHSDWQLWRTAMDEETGTLNNKVPYMHEPPRYEGQGEHTVK